MPERISLADHITQERHVLRVDVLDVRLLHAVRVEVVDVQRLHPMATVVSKEVTPRAARLVCVVVVLGGHHEVAVRGAPLHCEPLVHDDECATCGDDPASQVHLNEGTRGVHGFDELCGVASHDALLSEGIHRVLVDYAVVAVFVPVSRPAASRSRSKVR